MTLEHVLVAGRRSFTDSHKQGQSEEQGGSSRFQNNNMKALQFFPLKLCCNNNKPTHFADKHPSHRIARRICLLCLPALPTYKSAKSALDFSLHHISKPTCACSEEINPSRSHLSCDPSWFAKAPNLLSISVKPSIMQKLIPPLAEGLPL